MMETSISEFHTSFYIPSIQKLVLYLPHECVLETLCCGNTLREEFKLRSDFQYVLHIFYCTEQVVYIFHTKLNMNTMLVIYFRLLKTLHWVTSVLQKNCYPFLDQYPAKGILCFITFCQILAKNIQLQ